jgi:4,5-DOPA dioxygenase extradiol
VARARADAAAPARHPRRLGALADARPRRHRDGRAAHDPRLPRLPRAARHAALSGAGRFRLAARARELLAPLPVALDEDWGLDHGVWSVLVHVRPDADVPVVQLGLDAALSARGHYELARRLAPLRDEGVLVLGSGNVVHNLGAVVWSEAAEPHPWATRFEERVRDAVLRRDHGAAIEAPEQGRDARLAVPTPEHYWPLLYVLAQQRDDEAATVPVAGVALGSISMLSVVVGAGA